MSKLKLQEEVLHALEVNEMIPFTKNQLQLVSALKSGQNHWMCYTTSDDWVAPITAAIIHKLRYSHEDVARALILVENDVRVTQYLECFEKLGKHTDLRVWGAFPGPPVLKQKENIYFGTDVVIATSKGLNNLLNIEGFNSASVQTLVVDRADQLMKVGVTGYTQRIADSIPEKQRVIISPPAVKGVQTYMDKYAFPFISMDQVSEDNELAE